MKSRVFSLHYDKGSVEENMKACQGDFMSYYGYIPNLIMVETNTEGGSSYTAPPGSYCYTIVGHEDEWGTKNNDADYAFKRGVIQRPNCYEEFPAMWDARTHNINCGEWYDQCYRGELRQGYPESICREYDHWRNVHGERDFDRHVTKPAQRPT